MTKFSLVAAAAWMLAGAPLVVIAEEPQAPKAANTESIDEQTPQLSAALANWSSFTDRVKGLDPAELERERGLLVEQYIEQPDNDENILRLGFLLSRPQLSMRELETSLALLAEIKSDSLLAPLRDLIIEQARLMIKLETTHRKVNELQAQVSHSEQQVSELKTEVDSLQTQLSALKTIETDITEDKKELQELPQ